MPRLESPARPDLRSIALAGLVAAGCFANVVVCGHGFVFDDDEAVVQNPDVSGFPAPPLTNLLFNDFWGFPMSHPQSHKSYRPLTVLLFRCIHYTFGLNATAFHVAGVVMHVMNTCLLYIVSTRLLLLPTTGGERSQRVATCAAILFATHPIHCDAVASIVGTAETVSCFFFLAGLERLACARNAAAAGAHAAHAAAVAALAGFQLLATLSKEQGFMLGPTCVALDCIFLLYPPFNRKEPNPTNNISRHRSQRAATVVRMCALMLWTGIVLGGRMALMQGDKPPFPRDMNPAAFEEDVIVRRLSLFYSASIHFALLLWPVGLCCDWSFGSVALIQTPADPRFVVASAAAAAFASVGAAAAAAAPRASVQPNGWVPQAVLSAMTIATVTFLPASNAFFTVGFVVAERVMYLPSVGFCLFVAITVFACFEHVGAGRLSKGSELAITARARREAADRTSRSRKIRGDAVDAASTTAISRSSATHPALGVSRSKAAYCCWAVAAAYAAMTLRRNAAWKDERTLFGTDVQTNPTNAKLWYNLAVHLDDVDAENAYVRCIDLWPTYTHAWYNLGNLYARTRRSKRAVQAYEAALEVEPSHVDTLVNYGNLRRGQKRLDHAIALYRRAYSTDNRNRGVLVNLGDALRLSGQLEESKNILHRALDLYPGDVDAMLSFALCVYQLGDVVAALDLSRQVLRGSPHHPTAKAVFDLVSGVG